MSAPFRDPNDYAKYARDFMNERSPFLKLTEGDKVPEGLEQLVLLGGPLWVDAAVVMSGRNAFEEELDKKLQGLVDYFNYACIMGDGGLPALPECDKDDKDGFSVAGYEKTRADYHITGTNPVGAVWFPPGHRAFFKLPLPLYVTPFECETMVDLATPAYGYRIAAAVYGKAVR